MLNQLVSRINANTATDEDYACMATLRYYQYIDNDGVLGKFEFLFTLRKWQDIETRAEGVEIPAYDRMVELVPELGNNPSDDDEFEDDDDDYDDGQLREDLMRWPELMNEADDDEDDDYEDDDYDLL